MTSKATAFVWSAGMLAVVVAGCETSSSLPSNDDVDQVNEAAAKECDYFRFAGEEEPSGIPHFTWVGCDATLRDVTCPIGQVPTGNFDQGKQRCVHPKYTLRPDPIGDPNGALFYVCPSPKDTGKVYTVWCPEGQIPTCTDNPGPQAYCQRATVTPDPPPGNGGTDGGGEESPPPDDDGGGEIPPPVGDSTEGGGGAETAAPGGGEILFAQRVGRGKDPMCDKMIEMAANGSVASPGQVYQLMAAGLCCASPDPTAASAGAGAVCSRVFTKETPIWSACVAAVRVELEFCRFGRTFGFDQALDILLRVLTGNTSPPRIAPARPGQRPRIR